MKHNGFTLVEVLAVIIILSALVLLGIFSVDGIIKVAGNKSYESQINEIKYNAENFINVESTPYWCNLAETGDYCFITLRYLASKNYIKLDNNGEFVNPSTEEPFSLETLIIIKKYGKNYLFEVKDDITKFIEENITMANRGKIDALKSSASMYYENNKNDSCHTSCNITVKTLMDNNYLERGYYNESTAITINNGQVTIE